MTRPPAGGGRLLASAVVLATTGTLLLCVGISSNDQPTAESQARSGASRAAAPRADKVLPVEAARPEPASPLSSGPPGRSPAPASVTDSATASASPDRAGAGELPPPGSGPSADPLIQQVLDQATHPDLPPDAERQLLTLGREQWLKETAGYTQVRIQAATARRDTAPLPSPSAGTGRPEAGRAVVRLVWAGADPAGTFLDGRPAAVHFTPNGDGTWNRT
ncbi:hypothetical protein ABZZ17_18475 [Streptomyces sp. NPDC006512]|uniref:hypothetical protein n=1 Tax=Streptomyces sp. NPDC006512 TaxID=3154307 RepID=UPI0033B98458